MTQRRQDESLETLTGERAGTQGAAEVDVGRSRFPYAVVWTPIPLLTWLLPFIGHMGIADSQGIIYDFAGPYSIGKDNFAFGKPTRFLTLDPSKASFEGKSGAAAFDQCVLLGSRDYSKRMHNLCCDNCHSHVARCLNYMGYGGRSNWNMVLLAAWLFFAGKFVTPARTVATFLPFCLLAGGVTLLAVL